ncbi:MAG TPA: hypothetical protein VLA89_11105, partial [Gemmatimonadales bacterium]|nr:hypothetical protein [Gemmatimonadales bacterium]
LPAGMGPVTAAALLAVLSPRAHWSVNVRWARRVARQPMARVSTPANRRKAWRIRLGERPAAVLGGLKVRAFWRAIAGDPEAAVIDVWMTRAMGLPYPLSDRQYSEAADAITRAAEIVGETTRDFQAIVWMQVRGVKPTDPIGFRPVEEVS